MADHKTMMTKVAPLILCDDKPLAEISEQRYIAVQVKVGSHSFHGKNKKKGGIELDIQPNHTYYIRIKLDQDGFFLRFAGLELVPEENGRFDVKQFKPLDKKKIKNDTIS